jgi:hypothetical protein
LFLCCLNIDFQNKIYKYDIWIALQNFLKKSIWVNLF